MESAYGNYVISSTCKLIIKHISKTSTKIKYIWSRVTALLTKILKTKSCYIIFTNHESWRKIGLSLCFIVYWKLICFWCTQMKIPLKWCILLCISETLEIGKLYTQKIFMTKVCITSKHFLSFYPQKLRHLQKCIFSYLKVLYVHMLEIINE